MATVLDRVIRHYGNRRRLSMALELSERAAYQWRWVPADHCLQVSRETGIPLAELLAEIPRRAA